MKFYEQFIKYMEEADIERLAKQDSREAYDDELDKKEAFKASLMRQDEEPEKDDFELENEFYEILGRMKIDQPELFDMFIQRLEDKGFRDQLRSIAGVSL